VWRFAAVAVAAAACGRVGFDPVEDVDGDSDIDRACANVAGDSRLLACYAFEHATTDDSGHGHDGVAATVTYTAGNAGSAIQFGSAGPVDVAAAASLQPANQINVTLEAWIRTDAVPAAGARYVIIDHGNGVILAIGPGSTLRFIVHAATTIATAETAPGTIVPGQWMHVAGLYDGTDATAWIDGTRLASSPESGILAFESGAGVRIGGNLQDVNNPNPDDFVGAIDDVRLWSDVITQ